MVRMEDVHVSLRAPAGAFPSHSPKRTYTIPEQEEGVGWWGCRVQGLVLPTVMDLTMVPIW